jgi:hypothetical protein
MAKRVIALLGQPIQNEDRAAAEAITPGHLCTINGSGLWIKHATAAAKCMPNYAMERDEMGKGIDDAYAIGDTVKMGAFSPGMRVNALLAAAAGAITVDDYLESAGNGTLRLLAAGVAIAKALEAVDNSAGGTAARIRVEVI